MTHRSQKFAAALAAWYAPTYTRLAVFVLLVVPAGPALADAPAIDLTKVGSPIWKPADFQLFTAPADPFPDAFFDTLDALLPLEGPGVPTYTPHQPPYDTELSTNAAAAGFVNQQVFPESAITLDPNGVYFVMMWLPDPGVTGSSRDFASGPVIPNSLFPFTSLAEMWLDGVKVETLQDQMVNIRPDAPGKPGDVGFDGASHRPARSSGIPGPTPTQAPPDTTRFAGRCAMCKATAGTSSHRLPWCRNLRRWRLVWQLHLALSRLVDVHSSGDSPSR